jgi:tetratricopeptide (TPR) repeat protein
MKSRNNSNKGKFVIALVLLFSIPYFSGAENFPALFKQGNDAYAKARYQQAIGLYEQMLNGGCHSEEVYFNLGNAYFKLGDIPSALLNYEKAHKLVPGDEDINFNIYFANSKTSDKVEPAPEFFATRWWHNIILHYPMHTLSILSILLLVAGSGLMILYLFANIVQLKKAAFYLGLVVIFSGVLTVFIANRQQHYFNDYQQAIIFSGSVNVRSAPLEQAVTLFVLHEGTKVNILDNSNGWLKIQLANGTEGWIHQADIKDI